MCPGVLVDTSIPGNRVARFLAAIHGEYPEFITDNGPEFISNALDQGQQPRGHADLQSARQANAFV